MCVKDPKSIPVDRLITETIKSNPDKIIDVFIEEKTYPEAGEEGDSYLGQVRTYFSKCFKSKDKKEIESVCARNSRFHWNDVRLTFEDSLTYWTLNDLDQAIYNVETLDVMDEKTKEIISKILHEWLIFSKIVLLQEHTELYALTRKEIDRITNPNYAVVKPILRMKLNETFVSYLSTRSLIPDLLGQNLMENHIINSLIQLQSLSEKEDEVEKDNEIEQKFSDSLANKLTDKKRELLLFLKNFRKILRILNDLRSDFVDFYTIARMFKQINDADEKRKEMRNVMIYVGDAHAANIRKMLRDFGFVTVAQTSADKNHNYMIPSHEHRSFMMQSNLLKQRGKGYYQCISLACFKQPFFS